MSRARLNKNFRRKGALERLKEQLKDLIETGPSSNSKRNDKEYIQNQITILEGKVTK